MGIEAKLRQWQLGKNKLDVFKTITSEGHRQINTLELNIFMPYELDSEKYEILQITAEECPVNLNLEGTVILS